MTCDQVFHFSIILIGLFYFFGTCVLVTTKEVCEAYFPALVGLMWVTIPIWLPFHMIGTVISWLACGATE